jgi:hypothetical protein
MTDKATSNPARLTPPDQGKAIGSANDPSVLRSSVREGVAQEGVIPASDVNVCSPETGRKDA